MTGSTRQSEGAEPRARLQELFEMISSWFDHASEDQQRRVLRALEHLRQGERREHPRKPCSIEVTYTTEDRTFTDFIKNISMGGVFMQTSASLNVGQQISLVFPFPTQEEPIRMTGQVVWKSPVGVGVKFIELSRGVREMIEAL